MVLNIGTGISYRNRSVRRYGNGLESPVGLHAPERVVQQRVGVGHVVGGHGGRFPAAQLLQFRDARANPGASVAAARRVL